MIEIELPRKSDSKNEKGIPMLPIDIPRIPKPCGSRGYIFLTVNTTHPYLFRLNRAAVPEQTVRRINAGLPYNTVIMTALSSCFEDSRRVFSILEEHIWETHSLTEKDKWFYYTAYQECIDWIKLAEAAAPIYLPIKDNSHRIMRHGRLLK